MDYGLRVGWEECGDHCLQLTLWNLAERDRVDLGTAAFVLNSFLVCCDGLGDGLGPREESMCHITEFLDTNDLNVLTWYGFAPTGDPGIVFHLPLEG